MVGRTVLRGVLYGVMASVLASGSGLAAERRSVIESRARELKGFKEKETAAAGGGSITANVLLVVKTGPANFSVDESTTMPVSDTTTFSVNDVFNLEVWAQIENHASGLAAVSADINFDPAELQSTESTTFPFGFGGSAPGVFNTFLFDDFPNAIVDNVNGKIDDLSGGYIACASDPAGVGPNNWARVAIIEMQALVAGSPTITATGTGNPVRGLAPCGQSDLPQSAITYIGINEPTADLLLNIAPGSENVTQGDTVTATLEVANLATAINGVQTVFSYDNSLLQLDSIVPNDLGLTLPEAGWLEVFENDVSGDVAYAALITGGSTMADGVVATLTFTAIGAGTTNLAFLSDNPPAHPTIANELTDAATAGSIAPTTTDSGNVTIAGCDDGIPCTTDSFDGSMCVATLDAGFCLIGGSCVASGAADPSNECRECNPAVVTDDYSNVGDGTSCDDGDLCTQTDTCQSGACSGGNPVVCTALDQCHVPGTCDPATGVCDDPDAEDGTPCDDGDLCTQTDTCMSGSCDGSNPVVCTALDQCHVPGTCDPATGLCDDPDAPNGTSCDDGQACTDPDACVDGVCVGDVIDGCIVCADAGDCDDGNDCTIDDCVDNACVFTDQEDGTPCDDGDACTQTDTCASGTCDGSSPVVCTPLSQCHVAGTCDPATGICDDPLAKDGTSCDDGNACTQTDACMSGMCDGSNPVVCTPLSQCHVPGTCDPATGVCDDPLAKDGTSCDDGNACTQTDACMSGMCDGSNPVVCTPLSQCHIPGTCDPATGICDDPVAEDGTSCDDGDACTQTDACMSGMCDGSNPVVCTPLSQCHVAGTCDPATGICDDPLAEDGTSCDDGDACTQTDECVSGACDGTNPVVCTPLSQCHVAGTCDPGTGLCDDPLAEDGTPCDDGEFCTDTDECLSGECLGMMLDCDDMDPCTVDSCDEAGDTCVNDEMTSVTVSIEIADLAPAASVTRTVTVVMTECGGPIDVRNVPVTFDANGLGSVLLMDVSRDAEWIHVAERHTLGKVLPLVFDGVDGCDATADFIGSDGLLSGDFGNGTVSQDNLVDITDAAILSINWGLAIDPNADNGADATGDGLQDDDDFAVVQSNFAVSGDPFDLCPAASTGLNMGAPVAATSIPVTDVAVPNAFLADKNADGWIDYRDIEQFAAEKGLRLSNTFRAKLRGAEATGSFNRLPSKR